MRYLVVSRRLVGQFLLKELTERSVLPLQVKHQHLQLDALLPQILMGHRDSVKPDQTRQDQVRPGQARLGRTRPGQARPDQNRPDQTRPDQARLGRTRPGQTGPD